MEYSEGKINAKYCSDCQAGPFSENAFECASCHSRSLEEKTLTGKGIILTFSIVHNGIGSFKDLSPYALCVIRLKENINTIGVIDQNIESIAIDDEVVIYEKEISNNELKKIQFFKRI